MFYPVSQPGRRVRHALLISFGWVWVVLKGHLGGIWVEIGLEIGLGFGTGHI